MIGGGAIGLASAWKASRAGMSVALVDPAPGRGASWMAAGMLAPVTEAHYGEEALLALGLAAAGQWPPFAAELEEATGMDVGYLRCGTLLAAFDEDDREAAHELYELQRSLALDVDWLVGSKARELEGNLAPGVRAALWARHDHQVRTRALVAALEAACHHEGTRFVTDKAVELLTSAGSVSGVRLASGGELAATRVVIAAGCWSGGIAGVPEGALPPLRPVKGQIIRLAPPPTSGASPQGVTWRLIGRTVRGIVMGAPIYLVPRSDGSVLLGATSEELGFDTSVTAGGLHDLLRRAHRLVPGVSEMVLVDASAGLRPATPDNAPVLAAYGVGSGVDGLIVATGHYRNGILLTPISAVAVAAWLTGSEPPAAILPFGAERFGVGAH